MRTFNSVVPKDSGSRLAARDLPYGAHVRQRLDIYKPQGREESARPLPVIIFIYGGSWQSGERQGYGFVGRALAKRGFLVVIPDYRLVPDVRFPAFLEDNAAAFRWVTANAATWGGDPSRIVLVGHSAGAYNAAMLALDPRWLGEDRRFVRGFIGLAGPYDSLPLSGSITTQAFGREGNLSATQPINFSSRDDPPTLLLHGDRDTTVYPRNSEDLRDRLAAVGVDARVRIYGGIGHVGILTAIARPLRNRAPVLADVEAFASEVVQQPGR